ncbi:hypothetical protein PHMEG_00033446 [Phytophthora megakarya]|uniref:Reverse transcriptase domain-containing protein n=1 Tax=Phytophthora megakarya TaxID=4795 RepID=A0A225UT33_9STRA|nr:hypothetical protein PHMEG_00033446 [Phytophthora megakarya]
MLLDCGATTTYVSKRWVAEHQVHTTKFSDKSIRVKLGDNQIVEAELEILPISIMVSGLGEAYKCVAVVYAIPDEFDCILSLRTCSRRSTGGVDVSKELRARLCVGDGRGRPVDRLRKVDRGAAPETDVTSAVQPVHDLRRKKIPSVACELLEDAPAGKGSAVYGDLKPSRREGTVVDEGVDSSTRRNDSVVEKMFTMGVVDEVGVQTKYITRKKLRKFLRIKTKSIDEPDFMLILSNETIKQVARSLEHHNAPFDLLAEYKYSALRPELPEGLLEKRDIEHRIHVKDPNLAMYRQQWQLSPEQQREIVKWAVDMIKKKLIRPSISPHAAPTFCYSDDAEKDILDAMSGAYRFSTMDLMSAYYQVRMREEDIQFTAFQAPNGLWEYLVLPMGVCNAPATMHRLTSKLFRGLQSTKSFYDDIYITRSHGALKTA